MSYTTKDWREALNPRFYNTSDDLSTVGEDILDINSTIKPLKEDDLDSQTLEAEKGEVLLDPAGKLFRILGVSHKKGGTPLNVPADSFIFSKFKPLAIDKTSKELFEMKEGGKWTKDKNTPAKVLQREVDIKHHNKMLALLDSEHHDNISKNSAKLMLEKNFNKVGQVAYLQEEKKSFPQGLPQFAQGTAPVEDPQQKTQEMQAKQFMQLGGTPKEVRNRIRNIPVIGGYLDQLADQICPDCSEEEKAVIKRNPTARPRIAIHPKVTITGQKPRVFPNRERIPGEFTPNTPQQPMAGPQTAPNTPLTFTQPPQEQTNPWEYPDDILPYTPELNKTFNQKLDEGYAAYNAINTPNFYPVRKQYNFTPLNLERVSERPFINQASQQTSAFLQNNQLSAPNLNRANASRVLGQSLDNSNNIKGQVYNQNIALGNQEAQYNNQGFNTTNARNVDANSEYVDKVNMTDQNAVYEDKMGWNAFTSLRNKNNDLIARTKMQMASMPTYGSIWEKNGQPIPPTLKGKSDEELYKLGYRKTASPLFKLNPNTWNPEYTGAGNMNLLNQQGGQGEYNSIVNEMLQKWRRGELSKEQSYVLKSALTSKFQQLNPYGG